MNSDSLAWANLSTDERWVYSHASAGLNALDTLQGEVGMPTLVSFTEGHIRKATLQFQAMMEDIHAKSYSMMNKTFLGNSEELDLFDWISSNLQIGYKVNFFKRVMNDADLTPFGKWQKYVASCILESALFYSGFFYPLLLAGQGKMVNAGEIFNLIIRDESVHGVYVSMLANELFDSFSPEEKEDALDWYKYTVDSLYRNEVKYTEYLYDRLGQGLTHEVKKFVKYNFNVLSDNLNLDRLFPEEEILPSVRNGLNTETKTHDFFSAKGTGYQKIKVEPLLDSDFDL